MYNKEEFNNVSKEQLISLNGCLHNVIRSKDNEISKLKKRIITLNKRLSNSYMKAYDDII